MSNIYSPLWLIWKHAHESKRTVMRVLTERDCSPQLGDRKNSPPPGS